MFTPAAARSPFSIRSAPRATWASRCSSRCAWLSLWALTPPLPPLGRPDGGHGPRASTRSRPRSATAAHGGSRPTCSFSTRSRAPTARTTHQRPLSPFQTLRREAPKRQNPAGVIMTHFDACHDIYIYIHLYIFIYLRSGGREPSGYPYGLALLVQVGTSPGWGAAAVGADQPCTPPCARAFGGARSQVPITFSAGAFGHSGNTRPPGDAPVLFSYIPRVLCPLQGGVIRPTPTGDQCVGPARALV